jgi:G3E family GTPase
MSDGGSPAPSGPTPLTLVGGFLGAGKTSLLNHLLSADHGRRLGVLVNDFGAIGVDARMIESVSGESVNLTNGCVCCSIRGDLLAAATRLVERHPTPDHLVVELSGVSRLTAVIETFAQPEVASMFELRCALSVVDADLAATGSGEFERWSAIEQLRFADVVVLNKIDLVPPRAVDQIRARLESVVARTRVWPTSHGVVPDDVVLGDAFDAADRGGITTGGLDAERRSRAHDAFGSWTLRVDQAWPLMVLQRFVDGLPAGVYRGKGIVRLDLGTGDHGEFQMTGRRAWLKLRSSPTEGAARPSTELVFVGTPGCLTDDRLGYLACAAEEDHRRDRESGRSYLVSDLRSFEVVFA